MQGLQATGVLTYDAFKFGTTIVYALIQSVDMVNDHRPPCWKTWLGLRATRKGLSRRDEEVSHESPFMSKEYLQELTTLLKATTSGRKNAKLECKHFFGGAAVYANGKICMSLTPVGLAIKLPEASRTTLVKERGVQPLRYFPKGPVKKEYVVLPQAMVEDAKTLRRWVNASIDYVLSLPRPIQRRS